ncbi:MAG: hypothetical protein J6I68_15235 [Butyrivibrio sp.]|uniref:hypothetical protein n=1 Tax=Butyrivibrio sp. TaxID=28121 RepID=UPI001B744550|nr:hypothetical protein [Butyrivibrio sp.]MBP3784598.1 hypothetical protein [Butyrivibrio sp.]
MFEFDMPDTILDKFLDSSFEKVAPQLLEEAAPLMEDATKKSLKSVIQHDGESELVNSVKARAPKKAKNGAYILNVVPKGNSTHQYTRGKKKYVVSNALKAIWLEYGVAGRQAPRPWLDRATKMYQPQIEERMQTKFNEITGAK